MFDFPMEKLPVGRAHPRVLDWPVWQIAILVAV